MSTRLTRIHVSAYRVPISKPVVTSFGVMTNRPAVFVRLEDSDGAFGFGEIFANWPAAGAEHRARLVVEDFPDLLLGQSFANASEFFETLTRQTHIRALQCGEWGPFRQVIAGLDTAFVDLQARREGLSVARFLSPSAADMVPCYASGIAIDRATEQIPQSRELGFSAFKVKVGFNLDRDAALLETIFGDLQSKEHLFADANQAWTKDQAIAFLDRTKDVTPGWLEEPLPADASLTDWTAVSEHSRASIAGGENITGTGGFADAIASGAFDVLQPDVAKWGGISGCFRVAQAIRAANLRFCPHFLGGGIGLAASAHVLAATGGDGLLEVDVNPNPLRDAFDLWGDAPTKSLMSIPDAPGLGITALPKDIGRYLTFEQTLTA